MGMEMFMKKPTLKDLELYKQTGKRTPKEVSLIAPHTNEQAAFSFMELLEEKLKELDIKVIKIKNESTMEKGWKLRKSLGRSTYEENKVISAVLSLDDYVSRVRNIENALSEKSETVALEIHAHNFTFEDPVDASTAANFCVLEGTNVLVMKNYLGWLKKVFEEEQKIVKQHKSYAKEIGEIINFDPINYAKYVKNFLKKSKAYKHHIKLIEIPSMELPLLPSHKMFRYYYTKDSTIKQVSAFEQSYCTCIFNLHPNWFSGTNDDKATEAVGKIIKEVLTY
ncbi:MAG: hypothetical protein QXG83_02235 [Candidatus Pacearchaeota archaeon]